AIGLLLVASAAATAAASPPLGLAADVQPPKVQALESRGTAGGDTSLRYTVSDDSGSTWDELTVYSGDRAVRRYKTMPGPAKVGRLYAYKLKETPEDFVGTYRFCVRAHDAAGNTSAQSCASLVIRSAAEAANAASIELAVGDTVLVAGTRVGCYAITSNGKAGMACVLLAKGKPIAGSFGAGLAVDGTAVVTRLKADGSAESVFKRRLGASPRTYRVGAGEGFGLRITAKVNLGCRVIDVTSTLVGPLYRGRKVSCWRATATAPLPNAYGVSISDKIAGVFRFDAKSRVTTWGFARSQPAG
ncbi:MAG: hypothetical protein ACXVZ4_08260, partial [Gaiellaceae bacterium]